MAPRQGPHARHQFRRSERLDQVIVGAGLQPAHPVLHLVARRQQQHRQPAAARAQAAHDFKAVQPRQADIEHQHVGRAGALQHGVGFAAIAQQLHLHAMAAQHPCQAVGQDRVVFYQDYMHGAWIK